MKTSGPYWRDTFRHYAWRLKNRLDRNRLTTEVEVLGGLHWRVTKQRGKIIGIEQWVHVVHHDEPGVGPFPVVYGYRVWKEI